MPDLFIKRLNRGEGKELILYSQKDNDYEVFEGLPSVSGNQTHLRFHPTRFEWVGYSTTRQNRTFLPDAHDCPLCPMTNNKELLIVCHWAQWAIMSVWKEGSILSCC